MRQAEYPDLMTTAEKADYCRESKRTAIRQRQNRVGPPWIKAGGKILYRRSDVESYLDAHRVEPVAEQAAT